MGLAAGETAVVVCHLVLWSQLGVLTRVGVDYLFAGGCNGGWAACLTSRGLGPDPGGAYFPDLPANALGCLAMGLLAASSTLALGEPKALAILPPTHAWQSAPELHIGLRTGFCGSLTTFSAWSLALFLQLTGGEASEGGVGGWGGWAGGGGGGWQPVPAALLGGGVWGGGGVREVAHAPPPGPRPAHPRASVVGGGPSFCGAGWWVCRLPWVRTCAASWWPASQTTGKSPPNCAPRRAPRAAPRPTGRRRVPSGRRGANT